MHIASPPMPAKSESTMPKQTMIESPRLILRAAQPEDAEPLHEAFSDPKVMRYWSELPHTFERTQEWLRGMISSPQNGTTDFVIVLKDSSRVIGKIGIFYPRPSNEIGFLLARKVWGKGFAKEALVATLEHLFSLERKDCPAPSSEQSPGPGYSCLTISEFHGRWAYSSITADTDPRNEASIGLLKSCGFVESGVVKNTLILGEEWCDSLYLRLAREEWMERRR
ncbi:putative N-acetyltransferase p20 [Pseudocercospora fuligena]|uniref:Putative N-acetyltransferase p20 n=1 Tax=Pseudocercospora fuligena TaxID=685502 RepID=A0A8H6VEH1_9PEZI|nr:putative N-acetyltransferase p20 [Pseudocercospora fuligena]